MNLVTGGLFAISLVRSSARVWSSGTATGLHDGGLGIILFLAGAVIPAAAMARTMNDDEETGYS